LIHFYKRFVTPLLACDIQVMLGGRVRKKSEEEREVL